MMLHRRRVDRSVPNEMVTTMMMMKMARATERRAVVVEVTRATEGAKVVVVITSAKRNDGIPIAIRAVPVVAVRGTITATRTSIHSRLIPIILLPPLQKTIDLPKEKSPRVEEAVVIKTKAHPQLLLPQQYPPFVDMV
jgi:hypothetical protein